MKKIPRHIAIIMDGNGRWAKRRNRPRTYGHQIGAENIFTIAKHCDQLGIEYLTVFAFSTENWNRPQGEVNFLVKELPFLIYNKFRSKLKDHDMKFQLCGRSEGVPLKSMELLRELEADSSDNKGLKIVFAFNYGGKAEIVDACKKIVQENSTLEHLNEDSFREYLYLPEVPDVDLLVRAGDERRVSNFLLWQVSYAEIYFTDKFWPDFKEDDIDKAIEFYNSRKRRFGKV